jgi:hypothetical protein
MCFACNNLTRKSRVLYEQNPGFRRVRKNAKSDYERSYVYLSTWNNAAHTGQIFMQFKYFPKICQELSRFLKIRQEFLIIYVKPNIKFLSFLAQLFLEWEMFWINIV